MVEALYYVARTGIAWRDLPSHFGPWESVYTRFRRWCLQGLWELILGFFYENVRGCLRFLDGTHIKLHQFGSNPAGGQHAQAIGRTKGGLTSKICALVDSEGRLIAASIAPGQTYEVEAAQPLIERLKKVLLVADKGFDSDAFRRRVFDQGGLASVPSRSNRLEPAWNHPQLYKCRHQVENFFQRIKVFRRISTRYEKLAHTFLNFVLFVSIFDWLK